MGLAVALFAILFSCQWAARMADKRGAGYVVQYTVLMAVMGLIGEWSAFSGSSIRRTT